MESVRESFPVTEQYAYFRHPAVAALPKRTHHAMDEFTRDMVEHGCLNEGTWKNKITETRRRASQLLRVNPERVGFVNSTSHGLAWLAESIPLEAGQSVLIPDCEFPANQFPWMNLDRRRIKCKTLATTGGTIEPGRIAGAIHADTRVLSLSSVQYHTGFRSDLQTIGKICHEQGVYLIVDAIQSLGWDSIQPAKLPVDALVADGHKWLCGPEGAGILYLDESLQKELEPAFVGWRSVKSPYKFENPTFDLRSDASVVEMGSRNTIGLVGMGESLKLLLEVGLESIHERVRTLRKELTGQLTDEGFHCRHEDWPEKNCSPIVSFDHTGHDLTGAVSFCAKRNVQLTRRNGRLRVGLHFYNNEEDLNRLLNVLMEFKRET